MNLAPRLAAEAIGTAFLLALGPLSGAHFNPASFSSDPCTSIETCAPIAAHSVSSFTRPVF